MSTVKSVSEISRLRLMFQMNNRLRLESLAALSKVFRSFGVAVSDELLSSIILAVPDEVMGYNNGSTGRGRGEQALAAMSTTDAPTPPPPPPTPPPIPPTRLRTTKGPKNKQGAAKRPRKP